MNTADLLSEYDTKRLVEIRLRPMPSVSIDHLPIVYGELGVEWYERALKRYTKEYGGIPTADDELRHELSATLTSKYYKPDAPKEHWVYHYAPGQRFGPPIKVDHTVEVKNS